LWEPLRESVARNSGLGFLQGLRVVPSTLGDAATLVGAGVLVS
jgi:glucokinase